MKSKIYTLFFSLLFVMSFTLVSFASNSNIKSEQKIDPYIYEILSDYENGQFKERNDLININPHGFFPEIENSPNSDVINLYDNRQIGENEFAATRVSIVNDLEQSNQDEKDGIVAFTTIVYNKLDMNDPYDYVMLTKVKGGIVRQDKAVSASSISLRYWVYGDAYTSDGLRKGLEGSEVQYNGELNNPEIGTTYYIEGPKDYYYCMGVFGTLTAGFMRITLSNGSTFECSSAITAME